LQRATVEDGFSGLCLASIDHPRNDAEVVGDVLENSCGNPPPGLLVHSSPGGKS